MPFISKKEMEVIEQVRNDLLDLFEFNTPAWSAVQNQTQRLWVITHRRRGWDYFKRRIPLMKRIYRGR